MPEQSDQNLIEQYLSGDEKALEILVVRYLNQIYVFVSQFIKRTRDAEDVTQEVFIKLWKNLKKYDQTKSFKAWIYQISRNTCIDYLRKKNEVLFSELKREDDDGDMELDLAVDEMPLPDALFDKNNLPDLVTAAMEKLPAKQRIVLHLYFRDGLTFQEIADVLGESINTVKSRELRAVHNLRRMLKVPA